MADGALGTGAVVCVLAKRDLLVEHEDQLRAAGTDAHPPTARPQAYAEGWIRRELGRGTEVARGS